MVDSGERIAAGLGRGAQALPAPRERLIVPSMLVIGFVYVQLVGHRPMLTMPESSYDDGLFMDLALNLVSGHWLGPYNALTLAKGPGFPFFLALTYLLGLPYGLTIAVVYASASARRSRR